MTSNLATSSVILLGVRVDSTPKSRLLRLIRANISRNKKFSIVTPNPEIIMKAQQDKKLAEILNSSDIVLPDGVGIAAANKFLSLSAPRNLILRVPVLFFQGLIIGASIIFNRKWLYSDLEVIKGREMFLELIKLANKKTWKVFFLGGRGVCNKTAEVLQRNYKRVKIECMDGPELVDEDAMPIDDKEIEVEKEAVARINKFRPQLLFVGFGAPTQEKWVYRWLPKLNIGGAMVVGGTFDYISGKTKLPPKSVEKVGLEWLWRLVTGSQRLKRIFVAFPTFPLKIFWTKWRG